MGVDGRTGMLVAALLAASAAVGVTVGVLVATRDDDRPAGATATSPTAPTPAACPSGGTGAGAAGCVGGVGGPAPSSGTAGSGTAGSGTAGSGTAGSGTAGTGGPSVPVYVLGGPAGAPRLYREFRPAAGADPVAAALAHLGRAPADPDYRTAWTGRAATVSRAGAVVTVRFAAGPADPKLAREQVVWTVTAADRSVTRVRVLAPGLPDRPAQGRADQAGVLAPVWLLEPADGEAAAGPLTVSGTASVFEAAVTVEVRRGTAVVARTTATASVGAPGRGTWKARLTVPPGSYVVAAYEESAKDGTPLGLDTKRVTVSGR